MALARCGTTCPSKALTFRSGSSTGQHALARLALGRGCVVVDEEETEDHAHVIEYDGAVLPDALRIGPTFWSIVLDPKFDAGRALTDDSNQTITLSPYTEDEAAKITFLHELLHAMMMTYMPQWIQDGRGVSDRGAGIEEAIAYGLSGAWLGFLRDNPAWVLYLMRGVFYGFAVPTERGEAPDFDGDSGLPGSLPTDAGYL